ncbi:MAG: hypothetical protein LUD72_09065 [Bacteroidales bacterium]|nr:hypothetical protein [Bacteroidales bacterium]
MESYERLCAAIVGQAAKDYYRALKHHERVPSDKGAIWTIDECELFFREDMSLYTDMDGEYIIRKIRERAKRGE